MSLNIPDTPQKRVVIIGGGFAGIELAKRLKNKNLQVVIFDRHNYHTFQPLLYQVATAGLEPDSIAYPLRKLFQRSKNCYFRLAEVSEINTSEQKIVTNIGTLAYDFLVVATGSKTNYFNLEPIKQTLMPMKTIPQALDLRSIILQNFEKALLSDNETARNALMNMVIVGGGPTGVELAGALAEMKLHVLPHDYPELNLQEMEIHVFEAAPRILAAMSEDASQKALIYLQELGVKVHLQTLVKGYNQGVVQLSDGNTLISETLIWTAGVQGATIEGFSAEAQHRGRLKVDAMNRVVGFDNVFAVGDVAAMTSDQFPNGHPMLAPVAMQQGRLLAKNLLRLLKNEPLQAFEYNDKGSMATIGRNRAVVDLPFYRFQGFAAWFVWMFVHIMSLVGFRNKTSVFINWVYSYFTYNRALRLIIRPFMRR